MLLRLRYFTELIGLTCLLVLTTANQMTELNLLTVFVVCWVLEHL